MSLADTPTTWRDGPSMSTLHVLLIFAGIPLLVIAAVSLLVLAPGWMSGPRYRPGLPWEARTERFGALATPQASEAEGDSRAGHAVGTSGSSTTPRDGAGPVPAATGGSESTSAAGIGRDDGTGGASAGW